MESEALFLTHHYYGQPEEVVRMERRALSPLKEQEVLVAVKAASINPSDINMLEGKYGILPPLPSPLGRDGVGVVVSTGKGVSSFSPGDHVIAPLSTGLWAERVVLSKQELYKIPQTIPFDQAAMLSVNPPTAWLMLNTIVNLNPGDWIVQNGANSAVGRAVIVIARSMGIHTVNVVRREELFDDLKAIGADTVFLDEKESVRKIQSITKGNPPKLAFNTVGGESARFLARTLGDGGTIVTYGAMSKQPFILDSGLMIFKEMLARGFWRVKAFESAGRKVLDQMFSKIFSLIEEEKLETPIERSYRLDQASQALEHAQRSNRKGKILFSIE